MNYNLFFIFYFIFFQGNYSLF